MQEKRGITTTAAAVIVIVIVIVAGLGIYYYASTTGGATTTTSPQKTFKIAAFFSGGSDNSWSVAAKAGIEQAVAALQKSTGRQVTVQYVYSVSYGDIQATLSQYASQRYDLLIAGDVPYEQATYTVASQFPNTQFLGYAGFSGPFTKNVGSISWDVWEGYFLSGYVAGLTTKSNVIGFVTAFSFSQSNQAINAFLAGARQVNPQIRIVYSFTQDWHDPVKGRQATSALISAGADVIAGMGNGMTDGVAKAAQDSGVKAVGYLYDENSIAPSTVITSVLWNTTGYFLTGIGAAMNGQVGFKNIVLHLDPDKSAYLAPFHGTVPDNLANQVNEFVQKVYSGQIAVPTNATLPSA